MRQIELKEVIQIITSKPANNVGEVFLNCDNIKVIKSIEKLNKGTFRYGLCE